MGLHRTCCTATGRLSFTWGFLVGELILRVLLGVAYIFISRVTPFSRVIGSDELPLYNFPYISKEAFPEATAFLILGSCVIVFPAIVLGLFAAFKLLPPILIAEEAVQYVLGVSAGILLSGVLSETIKVSYGRPRPDYLQRCYGDVSQSSRLSQAVMSTPCTSSLEPRLLMDGRKSFPSAHSSLSCAVYVFLALFFYRKLSQIRNTGSLRLIVPFILCTFALFIGVTRTQDYRHHPTDVIAGFILGTVVTSTCWYFYDGITEKIYARYARSTGVSLLQYSALDRRCSAQAVPGERTAAFGIYSDRGDLESGDDTKTQENS